MDFHSYLSDELTRKLMSLDFLECQGINVNGIELVVMRPSTRDHLLKLANLTQADGP